MWFWKKPKKEGPAPEGEAPPADLPIATMGIVYRPPQPRDEEPEEPREKEGGEEGTSREARAVRAAMEPRNPPRSNAFDPSKVPSSTLIPLQSVQIATPCRADWSKMQGDDKSRFCQSCQKSVYNLSAMTADEAEALITEKGGDLCARLYRRADGTLITGDCPVGATAPRRPFWGAVAGLLAAIGCGGLLSGCGSSGSRSSGAVESLRTVPVLGVLVNKVSPPEPVIMGAMAAVPPQSVPPVLGKIVCPPRPKPTPKPAPTEDPVGEPEMGEVAPASQA